MFIPLAAVLALGLAWSLYWFVASGAAKARLADGRAQLAQQGVSLSCTQEEWGGYPFHFEFTCTSPVLRYAGRAEARSGRLLLVALAYAPSQLVALIDGPTTVSGPGLLPTRAEHGRITAALTFGNTAYPAVSAEVPALSAPGMGRVGRILLNTRPAAMDGLEVAVTVTSASVEMGDVPPLAFDAAQVIGTLEADGRLALTTAELTAGNLRLDAAGTIALDTERRPSGSLTAKTNDVPGLFQLLGPYLRLTEDQTAALRTMLALLGGEAKAPLIARDGKLYVGPFEVARLTPLY